MEISNTHRYLIHSKVLEEDWEHSVDAFCWHVFRKDFLVV